jgi:hypothetical protein
MTPSNSEKVLLLKNIGVNVSIFEDKLKFGLDDYHDSYLNNLYNQNFDRIQNALFQIQSKKNNH